MLEAERSRETAGGATRESAPFPPGWAELVRAERAPGARIVVVPDDGVRTPGALSALLAENASGPDASTLASPVAQALGRLAEGALESLGGAARLSALLARAAEGLPAALDASDAALAEAIAEAKRVLARLPAADAVLLDGQGPFRVLARLLRRERRPARARLLAEIRGLLEALRARLRADDALAPEAARPERLEAGLGAPGIRLDAAALARTLPRAKGTKRLDPERRIRIERTVEELDRALATIPGEPEVVAALPTGSHVEPDAADRVRAYHSPLASAASLFDEMAAERVPFVRATRAARMELDSGGDDPSRFAALEALDWQGFEPAEMALLPCVLALETGVRVRGEHLGHLSRLLRSGRPVTAIVVETLDDLHRDESWDAIAGFHPGLGYLAVAHREAFVLESSVIRPDHLLSGLTTCARSLGPALALVTVPRKGMGAGDLPALAAALFGRATPLLRYDPTAGETWAERFDLRGNPQPEAAWPDVGTAPWTFVHFAACESGLQRHVLGPPAKENDERHVPVAQWLCAPEDERRRRIPVLEVGNERRVVTRAAAFAALDRMRAWRILQELAGHHNEHARRAAERARAEAEERAAAERAALEAAHAEAIGRARLEAATEAVDRIVAALLGQAVAGPPPGAAPPSPAPLPVPAPTAAEVPPAPAPAVEEEEAFVDEPWIDSGLCTTCNECTNLNGRMFRYNANKQATIADRSAGTFEELVKAAEKCPARCIHVGAPPAGDSSVTDDLRARALKFR
jgi:ferredoxin